MHKILDKITGRYRSVAKVVDGALILTLPDAQTPVVWRIPLGEVRSSAIELQSNKEGSLFTLVLKTPRGDTQTIAAFSIREKALAALMAVATAVENAPSSTFLKQQSLRRQALREQDGDKDAPNTAAERLPPAQSLPAENDNRGTAASGIRWGAIAVGIIAVAGMMIYLGQLMPDTATGPSFANAVSSAALSPASGLSGGAGETGIPVSAEQFLNQR